MSAIIKFNIHIKYNFVIHFFVVGMGEKKIFYLKWVMASHYEAKFAITFVLYFQIIINNSYDDEYIEESTSFNIETKIQQHP